VVLHSFLNPESPQQAKPKAEGAAADAKAIVDQTREQLRPLSGSTVEEGASGDCEGATGENLRPEGTAGADAEDSEVTLAVNGQSITDSLDRGAGLPDDTAKAEDEEKIAPLLIATVVAPSHDKEASRAMARLEKLGVEFQKKWVEQQAAEREATEAVERVQEEEENADG